VRKAALLFIILLLMASMAACDGGAQAPTTEPTRASEPGAQPATLTVPAMATATSEPGGYPPFAAPTLPGVDEGYPAGPLPTLDPYPGGLATIIRPMGLQCEDPIFPDLSAAIASLEEAGITVVAAEEIGLEVCEACGCATSTHFRVQINVADLDRALKLGWQR
jgi:hypothetical protein